jgi:glutathione S-transferase
MPSDKLKILGRCSSSNVQKVLWLLAEMNVPFDREDYGGKFGRNRDAEYLKLNPNGVVPTLIDGDFILWESNTICRYLANRFGATALYPSDLHERALCEKWMDWNMSLAYAVSPVFRRLVRGEGKDNPKALEALQSRAVLQLSILDQALEGRGYIESPHLTLADIVNGIWVHRWFALGFKNGSMRSLEGWYDRLSERTAYREQVMAVPLE